MEQALRAELAEHAVDDGRVDHVTADHLHNLDHHTAGDDNRDDSRDDGSTDFRKVFREMGIEDKWILTPGQSAQDIRKAFQVFSQSAVRVSQGAASFSRTALGGFGA